MIERFGGIRPMADKLSVPVSTVQGWKKRATIPATREGEVRAAAARLGLALDEADLVAAFPAEPAPQAAEPGDIAVVAAAPAEPSDAEPSAAVDTPAAAAEPSDAEPSAAADAPAAADIPIPEQKAIPDMTASEAPATDRPTEPASSFADAPSPVAALGHAYVHGNTGAPAAAPRSGGAGAVAMAAALLAILGAGVAVTAPLWSPDFLAKSVQVDALQTRVAALETSLGVTASADASLGERIAKLEAAVGAVDEKVAALPAAQVAGALAAGQLRSALSGSGPFAAELAAVKVSGIADEATSKALAPLAAHALSGIPTHSELAERFAWMVPDLVSADLAAAGDRGIGQRMMGWVTGVAGALRLPVSGAPADAQSTPALVARAGTMLERGELAAAVDLVAMLPGAAGEAAAPWLEDARARLAADEAGRQIGRRVAAVLPVVKG
ncbi:COG4223 family protein [Azospirillum sp. ST 5-10]|uniref:COG4223 family protein n=1 Tax=unclassified Azospirillum TaxID=2630922 RepID=UPI003F49B907